MTDRSLLDVRGLTHCLPNGRELWSSVDIRLQAGEVFAVVGPNGSGKTTLLRTLAGLTPVQSGALSASGRRGYVPQASQLTVPYRVRDVVAMGRVSSAGLFGRLRSTDRTVIDGALAILGIEALADRLFTTLSGGERQLVIAARALASDCSVLIMDEPTAALDLQNQARLLGLIRRLVESGRSVVFSTHQPDHAFSIADRVLCLAGSGAPLCGSPDVVLTEKNLRRLYGVDVRLVGIVCGDAVVRIAVPLLHPRGPVQSRGLTVHRPLTNVTNR